MQYRGRILGIIGVIIMVLGLSIAVFYYAQGYRFNFETRTFETNSIIVVNSFPNDADIYINGKRHGVTQKTIYALPKSYDIVIQKEGYTKWQKTYNIVKEAVYRTDALMFTLNPSLSPVTNRGIIAPAVSPQRSFIVYVKQPDDTTAVTIPGEPEKSGIFKIPMNASFSLFQGKDLLLPFSQFPQGSMLDKTTYIFAPDEKELMVFFMTEDDAIQSVYLVPVANPNAYLDITQSYETILERWELLDKTTRDALIDTQKKPVRDVFGSSTHIIEQSPDKERLLYFATQEATLPLVIKPAIRGRSPVPETRSISPGNYYVYDAKNDKNYLLDVFSKEEREKTLKTLSETSWEQKAALFKNIFWYGNSKHVVTVLEDIINVIDHDGTNNVLVYSGPFDQSVFAGTRDGRILIVTNLNPKRNELPDLYAISIK